jgi:hypothetical protein
VTVHLYYKLIPTEFYTVVASTFKSDQTAGGLVTFESDHPLLIKEIQSEGHGYCKVVVSDEWDFKSAGGCSNFGMFEKNPVYIINIVEDCELQVRLNVVAELSPDG